MENCFYTGQRVVCINDQFEVLEPTNYRPARTPKYGEVLTVNEVDGEFLVFYLYNTVTDINYWHHTSFAPVDENLWATAEVSKEEVLTN